MNKHLLESHIAHLRSQRTVLSVLSVSLSVTLVLMAAFLFTKQDRVVVLPGSIEKPFWVDATSVSATYTEQLGVFLGQLLLNKSSSSADQQRSVILRHTAPEFYGSMRKKLMEEEKMLRKQSASYAFYPSSVEVAPDCRAVKLTGDRMLIVSDKRLSTTRESYTLHFVMQGGRLLLDGVSATEKGRLS